ncbi:pyruvate formate-lyase-activating protein [Phytohabitans sp. ZYX-F-186]|uniref:Pyruvate formate-lyase-activating enzyme n=1 Tax=Phytohabitans maris TaxID=3071409 RepID=A0ABU0ZAK6_9ACTN|nr:pyruvate formate-lyase-activating protein [Phytohabitans sp. ZYX-F-186]MDQ7904013.1 pyruvate formate-lyase-activating protein [Phytohabitans sp. ZYX-F-186]
MSSPQLAAIAGAVHSWDVSTGVDGPGTRFVVFLGGCPLRCLYCQNPDTWRMRRAQRTDLETLWTIVSGYTRFIRVAGGGLTVSGGEPLLQPAFAEALLVRAREAGLHTALDTSGVLGDRAGDRLLDATSLVLLDIKSGDPDTFRRVTGGDLAPTLRFGRRLAERDVPMWIRFVLVPGLTDAPANVDAVARHAASLSTVERVEVLPFHRLGAEKYAALGLRFPLARTPPPDAALLERVRGQFRDRGLTVY